jgi:hypothetical protein
MKKLPSFMTLGNISPNYTVSQPTATPKSLFCKNLLPHKLKWLSQSVAESKMTVTVHWRHRVPGTVSNHRGTATRRQVRWLPLTAESTDKQNEYFKFKKVDFMWWINFKLPSNIKGNSINDCKLLKVLDFCYGWPPWLPTPHAKKLSNATVKTQPVCPLPSFANTLPLKTHPCRNI